jgi:hypothetical protein
VPIVVSPPVIPNSPVSPILRSNPEIELTISLDEVEEIDLPNETIAAMVDRLLGAALSSLVGIVQGHHVKKQLRMPEDEVIESRAVKNWMSILAEQKPAFLEALMQTYGFEQQEAAEQQLEKGLNVIAGFCRAYATAKCNEESMQESTDEKALQEKRRRLRNILVRYHSDKLHEFPEISRCLTQKVTTKSDQLLHKEATQICGGEPGFFMDITKRALQLRDEISECSAAINREALEGRLIEKIRVEIIRKRFEEFKNEGIKAYISPENFNLLSQLLNKVEDLVEYLELNYSQCKNYKERIDLHNEDVAFKRREIQELKEEIVEDQRAHEERVKKFTLDLRADNEEILMEFQQRTQELRTEHEQSLANIQHSRQIGNKKHVEEVKKIYQVESEKMEETFAIFGTNMDNRLEETGILIERVAAEKRIARATERAALIAKIDKVKEELLTKKQEQGYLEQQDIELMEKAEQLKKQLLDEEQQEEFTASVPETNNVDNGLSQTTTTTQSSPEAIKRKLFMFKPAEAQSSLPDEQFSINTPAASDASIITTTATSTTTPTVNGDDVRAGLDGQEEQRIKLSFTGRSSFTN